MATRLLWGIVRKATFRVNNIFNYKYKDLPVKGIDVIL
jgi:hypothetical protein